VGEIDQIETAIFAISLMGPGFLILFGRSRFLTGRMISVSQSAFEYLMVSSVYFAFAYPIFRLVSEPTYLASMIFLFGAPLSVGVAIGFFSQKQLFRKSLAYLKMNTVHSSPTAWDFMFNDRRGFAWVIVSLNSGRKFFGVFGPESLASSDMAHRDLYIENICDEEFKPIEENGRKRGVWINESEILSIEIIKDQ
jgi:hypothetical protein